MLGMIKIINTPCKSQLFGLYQFFLIQNTEWVYFKHFVVRHKYYFTAVFFQSQEEKTAIPREIK